MVKFVFYNWKLKLGSWKSKPVYYYNKYFDIFVHNNAPALALGCKGCISLTSNNLISSHISNLASRFINNIYTSAKTGYNYNIEEAFHML